MSGSRKAVEMEESSSLLIRTSQSNYGIQSSGTSASSLSDSSAPEHVAERSVVESIKIAVQSPERLWTVVAFALIACIGSVLPGAAIGYSTNTISDIESNPGRYGIDLRDFEKDTFSSLGALGFAFGAPCAWPISNLLGRKPSLMLGGVTGLVGWLAVTYADLLPTSNGIVTLLYIGRFITGLAGGWLIYSVSLYIAEISTSKTRGGLGNCNQLLLTVGQFLSQGFGVVLHFDRVSLIFAGVATLFEVLLLIVPESPRWLYRHGKVEEARKTLVFLRGPKGNVNKEMEAIKQVIEKVEKMTLVQEILEFRYRQVFHPFVLCLLLMFFQVFCGINAVNFYGTQIFQQASLPHPELFTTFLVGGIPIIITLASVFLIGLFGRKVLLVASALCMLVSMVMLGVYFLIYEDICHGCLGVNCTDSNRIHLNSSPPCNKTGISALAVISIALYVIGFALGWGPVVWTMMSEILPLRVRTLAAMIATFLNWMFSFALTKGFLKYSDAVTPKFAWWDFGVILVASIVFVVVFLPETKGHSLEDVEEHFERGQIVYLPCKREREVVKRKKKRVRISAKDTEDVDEDFSTSL